MKDPHRRARARSLSLHGWHELPDAASSRNHFAGIAYNANAVFISYAARREPFFLRARQKTKVNARTPAPSPNRA